MALQDYAKGYVMMDGNPLAEVTSIERVTESGQQEIETLENGLSGFTPGGGRLRQTIGYVVPIGGTEDTFQKKCVKGSYVQIQCGFGPESTVSTGKIMTDTTSQSVGANVEGSFEWLGPPVEQE